MSNRLLIFEFYSLDTDSKLRHDTVRLSRTKHTDKTQAGLTSSSQTCLDESLCTQSHNRPKKQIYFRFISGLRSFEIFISGLKLYRQKMRN